MLVDLNINVNVSKNEVTNEHVEVNVYVIVNVNINSTVYLTENLKCSKLSNSIVYSSHARHVSIWCDCSCVVR